MGWYNNYWSCTKFADWIRGTAKPSAATGSGWREWKNTAKAAHRFRYWVAEEALDSIQNFVNWPINFLHSIKYYLNTRFVLKTHALTAHRNHIKRGQWCDLSGRFLPCLFDSLVDYVEVELAWWHIAWADRAERRKYGAPFWASGWFKFGAWRCRQAGIDNLEWQSNLRWTESEVGLDSPLLGKPTYQAVNAAEIMELYRWWTEVYPNRPDPIDASGWSAFCERKRQKIAAGDAYWFEPESDTPAEAKESSKILKKLEKIEKAYKLEDERMMIRLIKIREALWT